MSLEYSSKKICDNCTNWNLGICSEDSEHHSCDDSCELFNGDNYHKTAIMILGDKI